ncbi:hypothetical protein AT959_12900 [Dechloromonas denitrificans]|uniref:Type II secretion system protein GspG C-terminal domain-containing protein n=1 Tax=Dechloromonas denitrificans TaxID=281362 RepID=A0A133XH32_9RHOO|nr:hypothetical protein [Dechloromonas denitrificans]KXB30251.1 hypothetical protein AT959_12900 [Dechloromonas denitrificans]
MRRYYQFAVVVILVSILTLFLMQALGRAMSDMEEAGVQVEAAVIRTELLEVLAHREIFGGELPKTDNPVEWVVSKPRNYLGAVDKAPDESGVWYFDRQAGELIYRFEDGHQARFRLSREAGPSNARGVIAGVGLLRLDDRPQ